MVYTLVFTQLSFSVQIKHHLYKEALFGGHVLYLPPPPLLSITLGWQHCMVVKKMKSVGKLLYAVMTV